MDTIDCEYYSIYVRICDAIEWNLCDLCINMTMVVLNRMSYRHGNWNRNFTLFAMIWSRFSEMMSQGARNRKSGDYPLEVRWSTWQKCQFWACHQQTTIWFCNVFQGEAIQPLKFTWFKSCQPYKNESGTVTLESLLGCMPTIPQLVWKVEQHCFYSCSNKLAHISIRTNSFSTKHSAQWQSGVLHFNQHKKRADYLNSMRSVSASFSHHIEIDYSVIVQKDFYQFIHRE